MTKIAVLADLHGNYPATLAVEEELERNGIEEIWFLGDAVGKGPESDKTLDWARTHCKHLIGGNWDYGIALLAEDITSGKLATDDPNVFYFKQLGEERLAWLRALPQEGELLISGVNFRLFHGRPVTELIFGSDPDSKLNGVLRTPEKTYTGFICADCHRASVRMTEQGYCLNTGSIGNSLGPQPPRAHFLILEGELYGNTPAPLQIRTVCVPYDNELAAQIAAGYPELPRCEAYMNEVRTGIYSR